MSNCDSIDYEQHPISRSFNPNNTVNTTNSLSQTSQIQETPSRYIYTGPYFHDTQVIQGGTSPKDSTNPDSQSQNLLNSTNNNNILLQSAQVNDKDVELSDPLRFELQMSQSALSGVRLLADDEANLIMDSSCERETQDIPSLLNLDIEKVNSNLKLDFEQKDRLKLSSTTDMEPISKGNLQFHEKSITKSNIESQNESPFKSLELGFGNDEQTPWMNKIRNPFDETPNAKTPFSLADNSVSLGDTPSNVKKRDIFQQLRDDNERKNVMESQPCLAFEEQTYIGDDDSPLKLMNKFDSTPSSASSKVPNLLSQSQYDRKGTEPDERTLEDPVNIDTPSKAQKLFGDANTQVISHDVDDKEEPTTVDIFSQDEEPTKVDIFSDDDQEEEEEEEETTKVNDSVVIESVTQELTQMLPPSLVLDSSNYISTEDKDETSTIQNSTNSQRSQVLIGRSPNSELNYTNSQMHSSIRTIDNTQPEYSQGGRPTGSLSQSIQVPGTNPDDYTQSDVLTSPIKRTIIDEPIEVVSDEDEMGLHSAVEDSLTKHHRVFQEEKDEVIDNDDVESTKEKIEDKDKEIQDKNKEVSEDSEFAEKLQRLSSIRLSSLKSKTSRRITMDPRTLQEQLDQDFNMTQEVSDVEDVTNEQKSDDEDKKSKVGDGLIVNNGDYKPADIIHDTEVQSVDLPGLLTESEVREIESLQRDELVTSGKEVREMDQEKIETETTEVVNKDEDDYDDYFATQHEQDDDFKPEDEEGTIGPPHRAYSDDAAVNEDSKIDNTIAEESTDLITMTLKRTSRRNKRQINYEESSDEEQDQAHEKPQAKRFLSRKMTSSPTKAISPMVLGRTSSPKRQNSFMNKDLELPREVLREEPRLTLTQEDILIPTAVWCLFGVSYFPGILLKRLINGKYQVQFETSVDSMPSIEPLDLRIDDVVSFMGDEYIIKGLSVEVDNLENKDTIRCMRGYDTVLVQKKKKSGRKKKPKTNDDEIVLPISEIRLSNEQWYKVNRVIRDTPEPLKRSSTATLGEDMFAVSNQSTTLDITMELLQKEELQISSTPLVTKSTIIHSELIKASLMNGSTPNSSIFKDCLFFVTGSEDLKKSMKSQIINNGGVLLESNLNDIFLNYIMKPSEPAASSQDNSNDVSEFFSDFLSQFKHTALITDKHSRKPKYVEFLSLGWPIVPPMFIKESVNSQRLLDSKMSKYLLPSGMSVYFDNIKSQDCYNYLLNSHQGKHLDGQLSNNSIIDEPQTHVIIVSNTNDRNFNISKFIWWCILENRSNIHSTTSTKKLNDYLQTLQSNDQMCKEVIVYSEKETTLKALHKQMLISMHSTNHKSEKNTKQKGGKVLNHGTGMNMSLKFVDWEWLIQCVITGLKVPVELEINC